MYTAASIWFNNWAVVGSSLKTGGVVSPKSYTDGGM